MWGIDVSHTAHTGAQTGIQHVCRDLLRCFKEDGTATPVIYDPYFQTWRDPDKRECGFLFPDNAFLPSLKRSGRWSRWQKFRGRLGYIIGKQPDKPSCDLLFCPELFDIKRDKSIFSGWPAGLPKVAYFYDAIPFKFPDWTPKKTVERYPEYLRTLARFDHVACISKASEDDLHEGWNNLRIQEPPPTSAIPLGLPLNRSRSLTPSISHESPSTPVVLMVGTLEARKNHLAVLEACHALWNKGLKFELRLIGMLNRETGAAASRKIEELKKSGHSVIWEGAVSNERLAKAYTMADLFLYPSLYEGFGLPVLESLAQGLPTITTSKGALAELIEDGGCLVCDESAEGISDALQRVLTDRQLLQQLGREAGMRPIRNVRETCSDLTALFQELTENPRSLAS